MKHRRIALFAAAILAAMLASGCRAGATAAPLALVDLVLIDGTGAPPVPDAVILIRNGIVLAAGPSAAVGSTTGYERVSLHGAYVVPGFINTHVHSVYDESSLRTWLVSGVTTIRDLGYQGGAELVGKRNAFNAKATNARMVAATPIIARTNGYGTVYVDGIDSARATVRKLVRDGFDEIKIGVENDLQGRIWPMLSAEEVAAIVETAHAAGKRVSAHVTHVQNLDIAVNAGVDDIAHMVVEPITEERAEDIARRGIIWVPTLELWKGVSQMHSLGWISVAVRNTGIFFRAGGTIALGTDFNGYVTHFDTGFPITEARLLMEAGLSPMDVIVAGTKNAAAACGMAANLGTIAKGKIADLLVVKGDPLTDIAALTEPYQVYKSGRPVLEDPAKAGR
jgi:imidazolonepropionase-like amidohydrolase